MACQYPLQSHIDVHCILQGRGLASVGRDCLMHFTLQTGPRNQSAACQPNIALLAPASRSLQACLPQAHMKRSSVRAVKLSAVFGL